MKTAPIIYTDEDVRPDLLTEKERAQFPQQLTNEDRRQILEITRLRIDSTDYNGKPILSPEEWLDKYFGKDAMNDDKLMDEWVKGRITEDVVNPYDGKVIPVEKGIADIVQRLMDRGLVIDAELAVSGMITDNPHDRWINEEARPNIQGIPGHHIYNTEGMSGMRVHFPTDNTHKHYNDTQAVEVIFKAAEQAGLVASCQDMGGRTGKCVELNMPYLMDGTGYFECLAEAKQEALKVTGSTSYRDGWPEAFRNAKESVVAAHGGYAKFTDNMIQDRFSRFERAVQRLVIQTPDINRKKTEGLRYADFLTGEQQEQLYKDKVRYQQQLWQQRSLPYIYDRYREKPEKVDSVARMAGYANYRDYIENSKGKNRFQQTDKRWGDFQKLEKMYLTVNRQGMLKQYRINNGIIRESHAWEAEETRKRTMDTLHKYRNCGYPLNRMGQISIMLKDDDKAVMAAVVDGKAVQRQVDEKEMARLLVHATTPFEVGLKTFAKELNFRTPLNLDVSDKVASSLDLPDRQLSGACPVTNGDRTSMVDEQTYRRAYLLTRIENMPAELQQQIVRQYPPVESPFQLTDAELEKRFNALTQAIDKAVTDVKVIQADGDRLTFTCKVDGEAMPSVKFRLAELDFKNKYLPDVQKGELARQLMASRHIDRIFQDENISSHMKR